MVKGGQGGHGSVRRWPIELSKTVVNSAGEHKNTKL